MKSQLRFFEHRTQAPSACGEVLDIELSNAHLGWEGIVLEKGRSPHFYPTDVCTPYFYFALGLDEELHWQADTGEGMASLVTVPGDIWINPPGTPFTHKIDQPCYFVILAVEEDTFLKSLQLPVQRERLTFLNNYNVQDNTLKHFIELFLSELRQGTDNGAQYRESLVTALSTHYLNNYSNYRDLCTESAPGKFSAADIARVDQLIEQQMNRPLGVEDMAQLLECSKFHFLREFKKLQGITPYQHLLNRRLARAEQLLQRGGQSIAQIAQQTGFNDQAHLTRAFKKKFGTTPGKYPSK